MSYASAPLRMEAEEEARKARMQPASEACYVGAYIVAKRRPCRIVRQGVVRTRRHGILTLSLQVSDVFTQQTSYIRIPQRRSVEVPSIILKDYLLLDIENDFRCTLQDKKANSVRYDLMLPDVPLGFREMVKCQFEKGSVILSVLCCDGAEQITTMKDLAIVNALPQLEAAEEETFVQQDPPPAGAITPMAPSDIMTASCGIGAACSSTSELSESDIQDDWIFVNLK